MKQLFIYRKNDDGVTSELLRVVNIHPSFTGINPRTGVTNYYEFKKLANDLENTNTHISIT